MKRQLFAAILGLTLALTLSGSALAHHCTNPNKKTGAGSVGIVTLDPVTFDFISFEPTHPSGKDGNQKSGRDVGGFITIVVGDQSFDIFVQNTLPDGAMNAGPGDNLCDSVGIDDALACLGLY